MSCGEQIAPHRRQRSDNIVEEDKGGVVCWPVCVRRGTPYAEANWAVDIERNNDAEEVIHSSAVGDVECKLLGRILLLELGIALCDVAPVRRHLSRHPLPFKLSVPIGRDCRRALIVGTFNYRKGVLIRRNKPLDGIRANFDHKLVVFIVLRATAPAVDCIKVDCADAICKAGRIHHRISCVLHHKLANGSMVCCCLQSSTLQDGVIHNSSGICCIPR